MPTSYPVADDEQDAVIIGTAATAGEAVKVAQRYYDEGGVSGIFGIRVVSANLRNATLSRDTGVAAPDQPGETIKAWVVSVG